MQKILIIQTAFIGDVVLATGILEKLHETYPNAKIDFLVRKGNETLFTGHPFLNKILIWEKNKLKYKTLFKILKVIRKYNYDVVVNIQRFAATGFLTAFSNAKYTVGFNKNPFSFLFTKKVKHVLGTSLHPIHEIERNQMLISDISKEGASKPKLYPTVNDDNYVQQYKKVNYICVAPASVWFTKQFPVHKWVDLLNNLDKNLQVYLIGASSDIKLCENIISKTTHISILNLAGKLNFLQSASLFRNAINNYVNDSAPMHLATSVNAITTAIYCSTLPSFGFGPLSSVCKVVEVERKLLPCRPCGLHGKKACPENHFKCANLISTKDILN